MLEPRLDAEELFEGLLIDAARAATNPRFGENPLFSPNGTYSIVTGPIGGMYLAKGPLILGTNCVIGHAEVATEDAIAEMGRAATRLLGGFRFPSDTVWSEPLSRPPPGQGDGLAIQHHRARRRAWPLIGGALGGRYLRQLGSIEDLMNLSFDTVMEIVAPLHRHVDVRAASRPRLDTDLLYSVSFRRLITVFRSSSQRCICRRGSLRRCSMLRSWQPGQRARLL